MGWIYLNLLVLATLAWAVLLNLKLRRLSGHPLDFVLTERGVRKALARWDNADKAHHRHCTLVYDTVFPLLYGGAICAVLSRYYEGDQLFLLIALLVAAVLTDFFENAMILRVLDGQTNILQKVVASWLKYAFLIVPLGFALTPYLREITQRLGS